MSRYFTPEETARLPQWAQRRLTSMQADIESLQRRLQETENPDPRTYWGSRNITRYGLPDNEQYTFEFGPYEDRVFISVARELNEQGAVIVRAQPGLIVQPQFANSIIVKARDWKT